MYEVAETTSERERERERQTDRQIDRQADNVKETDRRKFGEDEWSDKETALRCDRERQRERGGI